MNRLTKDDIELDKDGVIALLKEIGSDVCVQLAGEAAGRCGEGYESKEVIYPERNAAIVKATDMRAFRDNLENNTIIKAVFSK